MFMYFTVLYLYFRCTAVVLDNRTTDVPSRNAFQKLVEVILISIGKGPRKKRGMFMDIFRLSYSF